MKAREWFRFQNAADDPSTVDIHVIDIIGDWIDELINEFWGLKATLTAKAFVQQLADLPDAVKNIRVHINSPGGDVFAATNIANALRDQQLSKGRTVSTIVDGLAASAASIIMMAGKTVSIADNALVMVHNPWSFAMGNAADLRQAADTLDTVRNSIIAAYKWHSSMDDADIAALMDAETWMSADEAITNGFATDKITGLQAAALLDPKALASMKVPDRFKARLGALVKPESPAPAAADAKSVVKACNEAGLPALAEQLLGLPMADVTARIATAKAEKTAADQRASEIRSLCATAKLPQLADGYINGQIAVKDVKAHLTDITAAMDKAVIDTNLIPDAATAAAKATIDTAAIYAEMNKPVKK